MLSCQGIYVFKKAFFLIRALSKRFATVSPLPFPIPNTDNIPVMADNVVPSMLIHLGVINLQAAHRITFQTMFQLRDRDSLLALPIASSSDVEPSESPLVSAAEAYILRAAAIDACERIVGSARRLRAPADLDWIKNITIPGLDMWLWGIAKDRKDYRSLPRFGERGTHYY